MIANAAVFVNGRRKFKGVNVEVIGDDVVVTNRVNGTEITRYSVVEVGKANEAWDVHEDGTLVRLVAQQGCGCSGQKPYKNDPEYTGPFTRR